MNLGREAVPWSQELWASLDQAVHKEVERTGVAARFIPLTGPLPNALTVPAQALDTQTMTISEGDILPLLELWVGFSLTQLQVQNEADLLTARTLAVRAAKLVTQAEDLLVFQGDAATERPAFQAVRIQGSAGEGLLSKAGNQVVAVEALEGRGDRFGENIVEALLQATSQLQARGHLGAHALVIYPSAYADAFAPLPGGASVPVDRVRPLVEAGFFGTATLPERTGVLVSVGGDTVDMAVGLDPITAVTQTDRDGRVHFRVVERFALRVKDPTAIVRLEFRSA